MSVVVWIIFIAAASGATVVLARRHRAYFESMGKTREARQVLYADVDRIVHQALAKRSDDRVEHMRPILAGCLPLIVEEIIRHGLIPVPNAVMHVLCRSLERGPEFLRGSRPAVWRLIRSLDTELEDILIASTAAMN